MTLSSPSNGRMDLHGQHDQLTASSGAMKRSKLVDEIFNRPSSPTSTETSSCCIYTLNKLGEDNNAFAKLKRRKLLKDFAAVAVETGNDTENNAPIESMLSSDNIMQLDDSGSVSSDEPDGASQLFRELSEWKSKRESPKMGIDKTEKTTAKSNMSHDYKMRPEPGRKYFNSSAFDGNQLYFPTRKYNLKVLQNNIAEKSPSENEFPRASLYSAIYKWMDEIDSERTNEALEESKRIYAEKLDEPEGFGKDYVMVGNQLWTDKYRPKSFMDLISDEWMNTEIIKWIKQWDQVVFGIDSSKHQPIQSRLNYQKLAPIDKYGRPEKKLLLLCSPPGLGKTTLAHVLGRQAGYNVVEVNASDDRTADVLKNNILQAIESQSVFGDRKPNLIVIDEIDGALGGQSDASFIKFLVDLANRGVGNSKKTLAADIVNVNTAIGGELSDTEKSAGKKKKMQPLRRPIICICNDPYVPALRPLRQIAQIYNVRKPDVTTLSKRLKYICDQENLKVDMRALSLLCEKADCDVRTCLNTLQFLQRQHAINSRGSSKFKVTVEMIQNMSVGEKDSQQSIFAVWKDIFYVPPSKRNTAEYSLVNLANNIAMHGEYDKIMNGCFENYLKMKFREQNGFGSSIALVSEYIEFYDIFNGLALGGSGSNGGLLAYLPFALCAFNRFCAHIGSPNQLKFEYPRADFEAFMRLKSNNLILNSFMSHIEARVLSCIRTQRCMMEEVLSHLLRIISPSIRPVNTQLMKPKEQKGLSRLVRLMVSFRLNFIQEHSSARSSDSEYVFKLEPPINELIKFEKEKQNILPQSYSIREMISREIELEAVRRKERIAEKRLGKQKNQKEDKESSGISDQLKRIVDGAGKENMMDLDLTDSPLKQPEPLRSIYKFHEGYSNAVRRPIMISDLLRLHLNKLVQ